MGAWGYFNFDNDSAADFAENFRTAPNEALLYEALSTAAEEEDSLGIDEASEALAAAEIVAAMMGKPAADFPPGLIPAIMNLNASENEELHELAAEAVEAVVKSSELQDLWAESADAAKWQELQQNLLERLS